MKKLYNNKGVKRVHPSPLPPSPLSALPTALLALASALSAEEQEVLAYLLGCEKPKDKQQQQQHRKQRRHNHPPELGCSCFSCYKSFWARWDSSPNRHVIHLIIDAFEETLESKEMSKGKNNRRKRSGKKKDEVLVEEMEVVEKIDDGHDDDDDDDGDDGDDDDDGYGDDDEEEEEEAGDGEGKSSVRRFVNWVFGMSN